MIFDTLDGLLAAYDREIQWVEEWSTRNVMNQLANRLRAARESLKKAREELGRGGPGSFDGAQGVRACGDTLDDAIREIEKASGRKENQ